MNGMTTMIGKLYGNSPLTQFRYCDRENYLTRGVNDMVSLWSHKPNGQLRYKEDDDRDDLERKLEKAEDYLKAQKYEIENLRAQIANQNQFLQNVVLELIHALNSRPSTTAAIVAKPSLSSYLDKKKDEQLATPAKPLP